MQNSNMILTPKIHITKTEQSIIYNMGAHDIPVYSVFFLSFYSEKNFAYVSIRKLEKLGLIISSKKFLLNDKRKNLYQLSSKGMFMYEILKRGDD